MNNNDRKFKPNRKNVSRIMIIQFCLLAVVFIAAFTLHGTLSYLSVNTTPAVNDFNVGVAKVIVSEPGVNASSAAWGDSAKPVYLAIPQDGISGVVRAQIVPVFKDSSGNIISTAAASMSAPVSNTMILGTITLHFASDWSQHWIYKNGWFYYYKVLSPGQTTAQLLAGVTLTNSDSSTVSSMQNVRVQVSVLSDILQPSNPALTSAGWGVNVDSSGNVS